MYQKYRNTKRNTYLADEALVVESTSLDFIHLALTSLLSATVA